MTDWQVKHLSDYPLAHWSGGQTLELWLEPRDGSYAERRFDLRLSSATIELDESTFTNLPDYRRIIASLDHPLSLSHLNDAQDLVLKPFELHAFSGAEPTQSHSRVRDFNIIYKPQLLVEACTLEAGEMRSFDLLNACTLLIFSPSACTLWHDGQALPPLAAYDLLSCKLTTDCKIQLRHNGSLPLLIVAYSHSRI